MCLIVKSIYDSLFYLIVIIRSSHAWNVQCAEIYDMERRLSKTESAGMF